MQCGNCKLVKKIVAKKLCGRCYQFQRRNAGKLPPSKSLQVNQYPHVITIKVATPMFAALWDAAMMGDGNLNAFVRGVIAKALPSDWEKP